MELPDASHDEAAHCLPIRREYRVRNVQAGQEEHDQAGGVHPVRQTYGNLPHIFAAKIFVGAQRHFRWIEFMKNGTRHSFFSAYRTMTSASFSPFGPNTCDAHARHGSKEWMVRR